MTDVSDPRTFLNEVPLLDSTGQPLPTWKRLVLAKVKAKEYMEKKQVSQNYQLNHSEKTSASDLF